MAHQVTDMVFKIYGTISYNDHSHAPIEVTLAYNNSIANPYSNLTDFATLERDELLVLADFFSALFPGLAILTSATPPASKTVTDFVLSMTGIVTYNDKSYDEFLVEYRNGVIDFTPASTAADWTDMINFNKSLLKSVLEKLTGIGGVVLAMYLFADCFTDCNGTISAVSPGPVCGWTFSSVFSPGNATYTFTPGVLTITSTSATDYPGATKPLPEPLTNLNSVSGRFEFTEYPTAPNPNTTYQLWVNNLDLSETIIISLFGDGSAVIQFGPVHAAHTYVGAWTPDNGAHSVHFFAGPTPSMVLDGVALPLSFLGDLDTFATSLPASTVAFFGGSGDAATTSSEVRNIFIVTENIGPQAVLGCQ